MSGALRKRSIRRLSLGVVLLAVVGAGVWLVARPGPRGFARKTDVLTDFGHIYRSETPYFESAPRSVDELQAVLARAYRERTPVRFRSSGHSQNGSSLPRAGELLIRSSGLKHYRLAGAESLVVGAGVTVFGLAQWLDDHGVALPFRNGGGLGPTVGGFVSAGGISSIGTDFGGVWENLEAVTLVDGTGRRHDVASADPLFPWLFGSMGQLGYVAEVRIHIPGLAQGTGLAPEGVVVEPWETNPGRKVVPDDLFWFTLFTPVTEAVAGLKELDALMKRYPKAMEYIPLVNSPMRFFKLNPPLLFPRQIPFAALFLWGRQVPGGASELPQMERDVAGILRRHPGWRRYVQSEATPPEFGYEAYFGPEVFGQFRAWKGKLDPAYLLNRGVFRPPNAP